MHSLMRSEKAGDILTKLWYPGMSVCTRSGRRLVGFVASFFAWGLFDPEVVLVVVWQVMVLGLNVSFSVFPSRCKSIY